MPTYETISELNLKLIANAASVQSNLGDGQLGLLHLTVSPVEYGTLSVVAFVPPINPGKSPIIPIDATAYQISPLMRQHATNIQIFKEYNGTDKAFKQQVIRAVNKMYIWTLAHLITEFENVTTKQILTHLYANYGRLIPADLQANDTRMRTQYNSNKPIFVQVKDAVTLAAAGQAPYYNAQILGIACTLIFNTGLFTDTCRDWWQQPVNEHNWVNFKVEFATAHHEWRDSQVTSNQAGYHNANSKMKIQQDTVIEIVNLTTATASDQSNI